MAWGLKEVSSMSGVDIEEDTRDDDGLLLQKFFKECLSERFK